MPADVVCICVGSFTCRLMCEGEGGLLQPDVGLCCIRVGGEDGETLVCGSLLPDGVCMRYAGAASTLSIVFPCKAA